MQYTESLVNLNDTGEIKFSETGFVVFGVLKNLNYMRKTMKKTDLEHLQPIFLDENVERYV